MLTVGQVLWWVPTYRGQSCDVTVEKVGRKWASLSNRERVNVVTLIADAGNFRSPGRAYIDKQGYLDEQERQHTWRILVDFIRCRNVPHGVTTQNILDAMKLLGREDKQ